ncbi:PRC-barrel domain-containing protein [Anaerobaca lacustris]|uniref:PRC-barrel domain-containing protein n=1 Tax=Anaerobaca lacustris TaxID=3044600 RepID=A0AAW6TU91_9BACT|nr:PRC-barrel domain-containing protein [Sedimentisphaerales bacterium M17dextr]
MGSTNEAESVGGQMKSQPAVATQPLYQRLDRLVGTPVLDLQGKRLGRIKDIVLDSQGESISYAALSYGGFFGVGERLFAVPWSEFRRHPDKEAYVLNVRKEHLRSAPRPADSYQILTPNLADYTGATSPTGASEAAGYAETHGFRKNDWPDQADDNWAERIRTSYRKGHLKSGPSRTESAPERAATMSAERQMPVTSRRVTRLIGMATRDLQGHSLGQLDGIVVDTIRDEIVYGVVILNTTPWALDRELALVPWSVIEVVPELSALQVNADASMLEAVAFARAEGFPYLGDPLYDQSIEARFEATPYWETLGYVPGDGPVLEGTEPGRTGRDLDVSVWRPGSEYNQRFDPGLVTTVHGTIQRLDVFRPSRNAVEGLRLSVRAVDGRTWVIHTGPRSYMESQGILLHFGDRVTIVGAPAWIAPWRGEVLMASTIHRGNETWRLRDANGIPQWNAGDLIETGISSR